MILDANRMRFPIATILVCISWYAAYPLRYRHLEVDSLLTEKRDMAAVKHFFDKSLQSSGTPESVTMDKSGANKAPSTRFIRGSTC